MSEKARLGILVSHPIQYYSPLFRYLAQTIDLVVFYCHNPTEEQIGMDGFEEKFQWDIDLLGGYRHVFLNNVSRTPSLTRFYGCNTPEIGINLREYQITHLLIMGWYLKSYIQAIFQAKRMKIKIAVRGDSQINNYEYFLKRLLKKIFYRFLFLSYDKILYVGQRNKEYLLEYGAKETQLIFSPHAVDLSFWQRGVNHIQDGLNHKIIFVWIGKFINTKKPIDAIKGFMAAYEQNNNMELWMIGTGKLWKECVDFAKNNSSVRFLGFKNQTELRNILNSTDALLLTSYWETWGLVVNECFGMGIPAIVSNTSGASESMIENGKTGFTFKMGNISDLKNKMLTTADMIKNNFDFKGEIKKKNEVYSFCSNTNALQQFLKI